MSNHQGWQHFLIADEITRSRGDAARVSGMMSQKAPPQPRERLTVARRPKVVRNLDAFRAGEGWRFPRLRAHDVDDAALRSRMHVLLPGPDRRGRPVLMYNARFLDPALPAGGGGIAAFQKMGSYLMEIATRVPSVQHGGVTLLLDLGGVDTRLAARFSAADLVRGVGMWKDCFPCKLKRVLVVRSNSALTALCHAGVALVRRKIRARVAVLEGGGRTGGFAALHEEIAPELLPPELGGTCDHSVYWARWCDARARLESENEVAVAAAGQAGRREGDAAAPLGSEEGDEKATGAMTADMASVKLVVG